MPIFTRRSRAGSLQIISTRLSKNGPMVTFCLEYLHTLLPCEGAGSEGVAAVCSGFCAACDLRAPRRLLHGYETQGDITFPPEADSSWSHSQRAHPLPANTFLVPTITDGYARAWWPQLLPAPYVGLTVHRAVSVRRSTTCC